MVSVGNELLYGETVDTNAAWLSKALTIQGIRVVRRFTVRDVVAEIGDVVSLAISCADIVFVSGGLGSTPDDVTVSAVAGLLDRPMVVDGQGREVPSGSQVLHNPIGTAPGLLIETHGVTVVLLPGVPRELRAIFAGDLQMILVDLDDPEVDRVYHRVVHTTGIPEPRLAEALELRLTELPEEVTHGISLAYLPDLYGVDLRFTVADTRQYSAAERFDRILRATRTVLSPWLFEAESGDLAEAVSDVLERTGRTLAVAESCTGGAVAKRMTAHSGASKVFVGGVIAYSNEVKIEQVGVLESDLVRDGAVSEVVARQLASGIAGRLGADVGVGITGVAGPGGGSEEKPVGLVWTAVCVDGIVDAFRTQYSGDREQIRERAAQAALTQLYQRLRSLPAGEEER